MGVVKIDVLLATYNGERYLPAQLASLAAQTNESFRILARDDGSGDGTLALLRQWQERHPGRMEIVPTDSPTGSASGNFGCLMAASDADYILFADQDDIWHREKVERTVAALMAAEAGQGTRDRPVMAVCDLAGIDGDGAPLFPSFRNRQGMDMARDLRLPRLLLHNVVTGCAMGVNRACLTRALPIPAEAYMHDWWLALVCAALGDIHVMPEALIDYRLHSANVVGAQRPSLWASFTRSMRRLDPRANRDRYRAWLTRLHAQAAVLAARSAPTLSPAEAATLQAFVTLRDRPWPVRVAIAVRYGFRLPLPWQTLGLLLRL